MDACDGATDPCGGDRNATDPARNLQQYNLGVHYGRRRWGASALTQEFIMSIAFLVASQAFAWSDLVTTVTPPVGATVYDTARVNVLVQNTGNKSALNSVVTIDLPETNTSPTVYVLGTVGAMDGRCVLSGRDIVCTLGTRTKGSSTTVWFDFAFPESSEPISVKATATTTSTQNSTANDSDTKVVDTVNDTVTVLDGDIAAIDHCTGTELTAFFECECVPSSISSHSHTFYGDGTLSIDGAPEYTGTWSQPTPQSLIFSYFFDGYEEATFVGCGVSANCFEGVTSTITLRKEGVAEPLAILEGHTGRVSALAFHDDRRWLVSGSWDGTTRRWSLQDLERPAEELRGVLEAAIGGSLEERVEAVARAGAL
jgi:hypothetical protein